MGYASYTRTIDGLERNLGYSVAALCDHPRCKTVIDRGLAFLCGTDIGEGGEVGCGRYFCPRHRQHWRRDAGRLVQVCARCASGHTPFPMKPDLPQEETKMEEQKLEPAHDAEPTAENERARAIAVCLHYAETMATQRGFDQAVAAGRALAVLLAKGGKLPCPIAGRICDLHGYVHGREAEELRQGIARIIDGEGKARPELERLLEQVDARDSAGYVAAAVPREARR